MKKEMIFLFVLIISTILYLNLIESAYDVTQGSDWKWAYAQTYVNDSLSNIWINDNDIDFAKIRVAAAKEDCEQMGGQWCGWYADDNATLQRMLKAQSLQPTNPPADAKKSVLQKFLDFMKKLFG